MFETTVGLLPCRRAFGLRVGFRRHGQQAVVCARNGHRAFICKFIKL